MDFTHGDEMMSRTFTVRQLRHAYMRFIVVLIHRIIPNVCLRYLVVVVAVTFNRSLLFFLFIFNLLTHFSVLKSIFFNRR